MIDKKRLRSGQPKIEEANFQRNEISTKTQDWCKNPPLLKI